MSEWETRRGTRQPITVQIQIRVNPAMKGTVHLSKDLVEAQLVDISALGVGMTSSVFLPKGILVDIELPRSALAVPEKPPPAAAGPAEGSMSITGQIVYARPEGNGCRMGLSITQVAEPDRLLIEHFVTASERRRAPRTPL